MSMPGRTTLYLGIAETSDPTHRRLTLRERAPSVLAGVIAGLFLLAGFAVVWTVTP